MTPSRVPRARYRFSLYISGCTVNSLQAVGNLNRFCSEELAGIYEIEIVDVFKNPMRALDDGVLMTPTLVKLAPYPVVKIVGTLSRTDTLREVLGLAEPFP